MCLYHNMLLLAEGGTRGRVCSAPNEYNLQPGDPWTEPRK